MNLNAACLQSLSFGAGGTLTFAMGTKGALAINNIPYTLLSSMGQLQTDINGNLGGHFALANNFASTGTFTGAVVHTNATSAFTGVFEGLGHTISNLTIKDPTGSANDGLFGVSSGTIRDVGLINASVSNSGSGSTVGSLVGSNDGSILNSYATAVVGRGSATGAAAGGLVGFNDGSISNSYATGAVSGAQDAVVGGLVGETSGSASSISFSYSTAAVSGGITTGGLVGLQAGGAAISKSYATRAVSGNDLVGGLW